MKKVIIFGFPHTGTSIMKSIIGHSDDVIEMYYEQAYIPLELITQNPDKHILVKCPFTHDRFFTERYDDYFKIFVIRDPFFVFSSINKRFINGELPNGHAISDYISTAKKFLFYRNEGTKNLACIRYEDYFRDNYAGIKNILNQIGITYSDNIFNNDNRNNLIAYGISIENIKGKPRNIEHESYRTWQINQPFQNQNDINKIDLTSDQIKILTSEPVVRQLYPDSPVLTSMIKHPMDRLIVLTFCSGYDYNVFNRFAGSLFDTGFTGTIYFFIRNRDIPVLEKLKKIYSGIEYVVSDCKYHVQSYRYNLYRDFLRDRDVSSEFVLICDSRDVLFQLNPEEYSFDKETDLYVFQEENKLIGECVFNSDWVNKLDLTDELRAYIKTKPIICSGTTIGTIDGMKKYLEIFCEQLARYPSNHQLKRIASDQGLHNHLIYNELTDINIKILTNDDNLVNTLGYGFKGISYNKITNRNKYISPIVHQYDRLPKDLLRKISIKYDFTY